MGGRGTTGTRNSNTDLSKRTAEQLDELYESALASKDKELMKSVLEELSRRPQQEESRDIVYTTKEIRRRGSRGRR